MQVQANAVAVLPWAAKSRARTAALADVTRFGVAVSRGSGLGPWVTSRSTVGAYVAMPKGREAENIKTAKLTTRGSKLGTIFIKKW